MEFFLNRFLTISPSKCLTSVTLYTYIYICIFVVTKPNFVISQKNQHKTWSFKYTDDPISVILAKTMMEIICMLCFVTADLCSVIYLLNLKGIKQKVSKRKLGFVAVFCADLLKQTSLFIHYIFMNYTFMNNC